MEHIPTIVHRKLYNHQGPGVENVKDNVWVTSLPTFQMTYEPVKVIGDQNIHFVLFKERSYYCFTYKIGTNKELLDKKFEEIEKKAFENNKDVVYMKEYRKVCSVDLAIDWPIFLRYKKGYMTRYALVDREFEETI